MFIRTEQEVKWYIRKSKKGKNHPYKRVKTVVIFECDNCHLEFKRDKGQVDSKRLDNSYNHVCPECDPKRFAQKKGVEQRRKLNTTADVLVTIDQL